MMMVKIPQTTLMSLIRLKKKSVDNIIAPLTILIIRLAINEGITRRIGNNNNGLVVANPMAKIQIKDNRPMIDKTIDQIVLTFVFFIRFLMSRKSY